VIVKEAFAPTNVEGSLALSYAKQGERSLLVERKHYGPLVVQKSFYPEGEGVCHNIIVHPPGGIAAGDRLHLNIDVRNNAHAFITTPGATKWYRSEGAIAEQHIAMKVAEGAVLEWLPQEAIVFNSVQARQSINVELADNSTFLGWDILVLGRLASQEKFIDGYYAQAWHVYRNGLPLWLERGRIEAGTRIIESEVGLGAQPVVATMIAIGNAPNTAQVAALRAIPASEKAKIGITALPEMLCVRYLGTRVEDAKNYFQSIWCALRPHYVSRAAQLPRIWST
jgi:urease accessory protein